MTNVDIKGIHVVRSNGRTYVYAWRGGPRVKAEPGTPEFVRELAELTAGRFTPDRTKLHSLIIDYEASSAWTGLSPKTKENWRPWLRRIQDAFGTVSIAAFDRPLIRVAIRKWRDRWSATPRTADVALSVLSRVLSFGVEEGRLQANACSGIPRLYSANRAMIIWTDEDLQQLERNASPEVYRAVKLATLAGLRKSDLLRLSWSHIKPYSIEIPTMKSGQRKTTLIPLYGELRRFIEGLPRRNGVTTVLVNTEGLPWRTGFGSSLNKALKRAKIDKHLHDTRGTAATRMFVGGLTIREIAEMFTWSEDHVERLINIYVKKDELLIDRIRRLDEAEARTAAVKTAVKTVTP